MKTLLIIILIVLAIAAILCIALALFMRWLTGPELETFRDAHAATAEDYSAPLEPCPKCRATKFQDKPCWNCNNARDLQRILARPVAAELREADARSSDTSEPLSPAFATQHPTFLYEQ